MSKDKNYEEDKNLLSSYQSKNIKKEKKTKNKNRIQKQKKEIENPESTNF